MDFSFGKEEEEFRLEVREFIKENLPQGRSYLMFEEEHDDEAWEFSMRMSRKMAEKGYLVMSWPQEYGGSDAPVWKQAIFIEECAYWGMPGVGMGVSGTVWIGPSLMLFGTTEQKNKFLPPIAAGVDDGVWCTGYSEPDAGSDLAGLQTRAEKVGDEYIVNGQKVWTSCAHRANWMWLLARTNANVQKKYHGLSILMVDMKSEGLTVRPLKNVACAHVFNEVFFKDVRVPVDNLVGKENEGWNTLMTALGFERGGALHYYGMARRVFDELTQYTKETGLIKKVSVRNKLADLAADIAMMKALAYEEIWKQEIGAAGIYEPSRDKAFSDILFEKLSRIGTEIIGAYAQTDILHKSSKWTRVFGLAFLYYFCPGMAIAAGSTQIQKNIVGQFGMKLPRSY